MLLYRGYQKVNIAQQFLKPAYFEFIGWGIYERMDFKRISFFVLKVVGKYYLREQFI